MTQENAPRPISSELLPKPKVETEERKRRSRIVNHARDFLMHVGTLVRQLRVHAPTNNSVRHQIETTEEAIHSMRRDGESISMVFAEGHTFVNGVWVRATRMMWDHAVSMTESLAKLGSRGMTIDPSMDTQSLLKLSDTLRQATDNPNFALPDDFQIPGLKLIPLSETDSIKSGRAQVRENAYNIVREGVMVLSNEEIRRLDLFMRRRQRGLVLRLVQLAEESTEDLLALTTIRDPTLPTGTHGLMVTIFAIGLGRLLGLSRRDLVRLGTVALNHNLGESFIDEEVFARPRDLNPTERRVVETHPLAGMRHILHHYGIERPMIERALASAEHHIHWDGKGGYPFPTWSHTHPFARIIAISDEFNALISPRPHRDPFPPDQALKLVVRHSEDKLDPVLVRSFVGLVGRYPPGSVVEMDTGEWGVVLGPGEGATPLQRPRVLIISDDDGFEIDDIYVVDLGERHARRRAWLRTIVRTRSPQGLERNVSAYLLADRIEMPPAKLDLDEFANRNIEREMSLMRVEDDDALPSMDDLIPDPFADS